MTSIRSYLLTRLLGGAALVLAVAGFVVFLVVTRSLEAQFDRNLSDRVQGFASILFQEGETVAFEFSDQLMPEYAAGERPDYFELWFDDGRLLERSESLAGADLALAGTPGREPAHWTAALPDGRKGRYVSQRIEIHHVYPEEGPQRPQAANLLVIVARGREELVKAERALLLDCASVCLVLLALLAGLAWTAVKRGLQPANRLAAALEGIELDRLPRRLDVGNLPLELEPVAEKTDALIGRVEKALERERRTAADIAHELRTPISELLTVSEVALRERRDVEGARRALSTVRDVAWRMGRSISTLLKLARLEMGAETFARVEVDLGGIVRERLRSLSAVERERGLRVENLVAEGDRVEGDEGVLRIVVSNLLDNALFHALPRGRVEVSLERSERIWSFQIENDSADLDPGDLKALTEPFWRKDGARADRDRSGLGLALTLALVERTGMELSFELEAGTFRAVLSQPDGAAPPARAQSGERSHASPRVPSDRSGRSL